MAPSSSLHVLSVSKKATENIKSHVILISATSIYFETSSNWSGLFAYSKNHIFIRANITSNLNFVHIQSSFRNIIFETEFLNIIAKTSLSLKSSGNGKIVSVAPWSLSAGDGIELLAPTYVQSGSGFIRLNADSDLDGIGLLKFGLRGSMNVNLLSGRYYFCFRDFYIHSIELFAGDISIDCLDGLEFHDLPVTIQVSTPLRSMKLGLVDSDSMFSLDNVELSRIHTRGSLIFGGILTQTIVLDGALFSNNASMIALWTLSPNAASVVHFTGSKSIAGPPLEVRSTSHIIISSNVTGLSAVGLPASTFLSSDTFISSGTNLVLALLADSDCDGVGDVTIDVFSSVSSSSYPLLIETHDLFLSGILDSGSNFYRRSKCSSIFKFRLKFLRKTVLN